MCKRGAIQPYLGHEVRTTKTLKDVLNTLVLKVSTKSELKGSLEYQEEILAHLIHVQDGSNTTLFGP